MELAMDLVHRIRRGTKAPKDCKYLGYIAQTKTKEQDCKVSTSQSNSGLECSGGPVASGSQR